MVPLDVGLDLLGNPDIAGISGEGNDSDACSGDVLDIELTRQEDEFNLLAQLDSIVANSPNAPDKPKPEQANS